MKIAFIGQKGLPANQGGVEKHTEKLSTKLASAGFDITVYSRKKYTKSDIKSYKNIKIINLPSIPTKNLDTITHTIIASIHALFQKYDIIHYQGVGPSLTSLIPRIFNPRVKIVTTFHSIDRTNAKWGYIAKLMLTIGEWTTCNVAHQTIAVSKELQKYCKTKYNKTVNYIPNAGLIDNTPLSPNIINSILKQQQLQTNNYFLTVSRLVKNKGLEVLIESYNKLVTTKKLVIVGDGPSETELKIIAKNNPNIIFTGKLTGETLKAILINAYLFIQPSESEGLSLALIEAIDNQIPVLVSDIPANIEVTKQWGLIFKNKRSDSLLTMLNFAEQNQELIKKNAIQAKKMANQEYNWDYITDKTIRLYTKLLDN